MFKKKRRNVLSKDEQMYLLEFARKTIEAKLRGEVPPTYDKNFPRLKEERGAFVTLNKNKNLRGCIGLITGIKPLYQTIQEIAEAAAFQDPRFPPLTEAELPETTLEISVLTPMRKISNIKKIKVRRHGLFIKFGNAQGLLLPQVATNNNWNRKTFLEHTCLKAGLPKDTWKNPDTEIMIFSAQVFEEESKK
ncbi:MAG: AmmeMemoRadiSam system protein A [bacterium]